MDWRECWEKKIVRDVKIDEPLINSLIKTTEDKMKTEERIRIDEITSSSKISLIYDSLRELIEALSLKKGFKIYNHECYVSFFKEIIKKPEIGEEFDKIRKLRNSINYYGKKISVKDAKKSIRIIKEIRKKIKNILMSE
jgi:uncharacterized protein (UPF0332 family)